MLRNKTLKMYFLKKQLQKNMSQLELVRQACYLGYEMEIIL
jgi:hypothetical protein